MSRLDTRLIDMARRVLDGDWSCAEGDIGW